MNRTFECVADIPTWAQQPEFPVTDEDEQQIEQEIRTQSSPPNPKHDAWIPFIAEIQKWMDDPSLIDDGENPTPTMAAFRTALRVGIQLFQNARKAPMFVIPTGVGGIVFERHEGNLTEKIIIKSDGTSELIALCDSKVFLRHPYTTV